MKKIIIPFRHLVPAGLYDITSLIQVDLAKFIRKSTDSRADILVGRSQNITILVRFLKIYLGIYYNITGSSCHQ